MSRPNFRKAIKRHRLAGRMFGQTMHVQSGWGQSGLAKNRWMTNYCSSCGCLGEVNLESDLCCGCLSTQFNGDDQ
jgi:hypothetical protein